MPLQSTQAGSSSPRGSYRSSSVEFPDFSGHGVTVSLILLKQLVPLWTTEPVVEQTTKPVMHAWCDARPTHY